MATSEDQKNITENKDQATNVAMTPAGEREKRILAFWDEHQIFEKSLTKPASKGNFVFYDGPPYATGLPHYGNALPTVIKDVIPRYKTMKGYHVPRRWGWDCHGLPIENLIEKKLGLKTKRDIENVGVEVFNKAARDSVLEYAGEWKKIIPQLGRWIDMENDYRTMDASYMESVMWSFAELNKKGLVYQDYKVMPYCPRCGTTLSNFEVALGYKDITDISAYVKFELKDEPGTYMLAWTTTPWTLPGNTTLAVNPELEYSKVEYNGVKYIAAKNLIEKIFTGIVKEDEKVEEKIKTIETVKGAALVGKSYYPVFAYYAAEGTMDATNEQRRANAWKVYAADFVTAEDGTGIVHIAPAFGEDDMILSRKENFPLIHHIGLDGLFVAAATDFAGQAAKPIEDSQKGDIEIIKYLAYPHPSPLTGNRADYIPLFKKEKYTHSYPHCWRCNTPLLNYATTSWFVKVTAIRDQLVKENNSIEWIPKEIGEGRFGKWLENARDWAVSRSRYWGSPLPVWKAEKSGKTEFLSSIAEIKEKLKHEAGADLNKFIFMRHGESESNTIDAINSKDLEKYPLTEVGRKQAEQSAQELKQKIDAGEMKAIQTIYSSDFRRTRETAEIVAGVLGIDKSKIVFDQRLREINAGDFDGRTWKDRMAYFTTMKDRIFTPLPNGESDAQVKERIARLMYDINEKHKGETILAVSHGLPIAMSIAIADGKTNRDLVGKLWQKPEPTGSLHYLDFAPLPHNEMFELDLHRPYIDSVTWKNEDGEVMRRVPEVFDVWYDSGSMSFAAQHYPFQNQDGLLADNGDLFPADFIAEGLDQTRGWFYLLLVMSTALFGKRAYNRVIVNGLVLAEDGRKMSKSLNNYPDLVPTVEKYGADSMRYFFVSSALVHGEEVAFSEKGLDEINKKLFNRLQNVYTFYQTYAAESHIASNVSSKNNGVDSKNVLDKWILSQLNKLINTVEAGLESYELDKASRPIADFIDDLSTWYLRRSRDRFKGDDAEDKQSALQTTRYVLDRLAKVMAPFTPFIAEDIYLKVKFADDAESVHLTEWPKTEAVDDSLLQSMAYARKLVEEGLRLRSEASIKVRQPLAMFTYEKTEGHVPDELLAVIADELNVKKVVAGDKTILDTSITPDLKAEGYIRELMRAVQDVRKGAGLTPGDKIELTLNAVDQQGLDKVRVLVDSHVDMFKKAVLAEKVAYSMNTNESAEAIKIELDGVIVYPEVQKI